MDLYYPAVAILFFIVLIVRIIVSCWLPHHRDNNSCRRKRFTRRQQQPNANREERRRRRRNSDVFVIDLNDNDRERRIEHPPSYELVIEDIPPPIYDEAVQLPPLVMTTSAISNFESEETQSPH